ncbi:MAG: hypothetical protein KA354_23045 [Phycisphaerae bacterium]|nr:hypothetical protein [Phycisphaerae bacterium]
MPRRQQYQCQIILCPKVDVLRESGRLLLDTPDMARFLQVTVARVRQLALSDRIPPPLRFKFNSCARWSVVEMLEWVAAGCPRREEWIDQRGWSGWRRQPGRGLLW